MKKIKNLLIPKKTPKYSDKYYRKILLRSSFLIVLLSSVLLLFFIGKTVNNRIDEVKKQLNSENSFCSSSVNEVFTNTKNISMFFARFKDISPLYQAEVKVDSRLVMLRQEATSFVASFDYLDGIYVETPDFSLSFNIPSYVEYESIQLTKPFVLFATTPESYPRLLKFSYTAPNSDTFNVDVSLLSEYLCMHYISENSYLLTTNGTILLAQDYSLIGKQINEVLDVDYTAIKNNSQISNYLYNSSSLENDSMRLTTFYSKDEVYKSIVEQLLSILIIYIAITFIAIIILSTILKHIYKPIKEVAQVLKYHMPDNDSLMETDAIFIKNCVERYTVPEDMNAALLKIKKSQLQTLHSQISPHLLGNSLEAIKWRLIPIVGDKSKLIFAITSLSMFLTEVYKYQQMITSIESEIKRTKSYADMMVYCFYPTLQIDWNVDETLLDCAIINLTLQPFIENSINHGFAHIEEDPRITINISSTKEHICIEIIDNGMGMDEETLNNIRKTLNDDGIADHHIGIKNSHLKLKLLFGDEFGVTDIQSSEKGTYIKLALPNQKAPTIEELQD